MNIVRAIRVMKTESISIVHTDADFQREVLEGKQPVFVEFSAAWCGLCHIIAPLIEEMAMRFRTRVKFCKIDMDDGEDLAREYGVQKIPTILFFKDGQVVDYFVGVVPRTMISQKIDALLQPEK